MNPEGEPAETVAARDRRGLKDHEIAQVVSAICAGVRPVCNSPQLRSRVGGALATKLRQMGLSVDY